MIPDNIDGTRPDTPEVALHEWIACKGCRKLPIRGIRWKCMTCANYDLCGTCHSFVTHPPDHKMLEVENPEYADDVDDEVCNGSILESVRG